MIVRNLTLCRKCKDFKKHTVKNPDGKKDVEFVLYYCAKGSEEETLLGFEKLKTWVNEPIPENCTMNLEYVMFNQED